MAQPKIWIFTCLLFAKIIFAWNPTLQNIEEQSLGTAFKQVSDFQNVARPEYNAYLTAGIIYLPLPTQSALLTEWGVHDGFAFRQNVGIWLTSKSDNKNPEDFTYGVGYFGERNGWDNEDFLFLPHRGNFSKINQIHTFGFTIADSLKHLLLGAGTQYINANDNTFRWWLLATYGRFSVFPIFQKTSLQVLNLQLNLQTRELQGYKNSWQNYLPDLEYSFYSKDSMRFFISQNLYKQKLYIESAFWQKSNFAWAAVKFYPDPSRLLLALEATATKDTNNNIYFGGGIKIPFLRLAYNHSSDYDYFFKSKGVFIAEFCLDIGKSGDSFFSLGGTKPSPSEINKTPVKRNIDKSDAVDIVTEEK